VLGYPWRYKNLQRWRLNSRSYCLPLPENWFTDKNAFFQLVRTFSYLIGRHAKLLKDMSVFAGFEPMPICLFRKRNLRRRPPKKQLPRLPLTAHLATKNKVDIEVKFRRRGLPIFTCVHQGCQIFSGYNIPKMV
jgi:hypothetical protein